MSVEIQAEIVVVGNHKAYELGLLIEFLRQKGYTKAADWLLRFFREGSDFAPVKRKHSTLLDASTLPKKKRKISLYRPCNRALNPGFANVYGSHFLL
jgi:hypothetical protein